MLEFLAGEGRASHIIGDWLDAHPMAALAIVAALIALGAAIEGAM